MGDLHDDRFKWADGLDVPVINEAEHVDYLYYVGCAGSYDASNQKVVKDTVQLLKKAGVKFAVMGKTENVMETRSDDSEMSTHFLKLRLKTSQK